ncbi:sodium-coupled monocarboxylate transporter 1 isoform X1 [Drosophila busckii]|uniref:sodium-coupled monocarboxylate transporter 1 isoform X1 n=1 Tax=Drosophila busckii TaxID=30019 RepID=UPI00083F32B5|nr:sodium-coupled monocarboxylate transporter 1 isoform X1 [Drosophila busckii]
MSTTTTATATSTTAQVLQAATTTTTMTADTASTVGQTMAQTVQTIISSLATPTTTPTTTTSSGTAELTTTTTTTTTKSLTSGTTERLSVKDLSSALQHFGIVDYLVFIAMLVVCAVIGFYFGFIEKKQKSKNGQVPTDDKDAAGAAGVEERRGSEALDYLVGGRKMKVLPVSLSLVASFVSGISLLGTSTEIYVYGTQYAFILITLAISGAISWYIFLPVFCNLQLTSTYEYFELRFSKSVRFVASTLFSITTLIWLPIVIYVPALAFNQVTGINVHIITPLVCIVCIFYTTVGGLKAVVWTDVIQTVIMVGAIFFIVIKGTIDVGGLDVVMQRNRDSGRLEFPALTFDPKVRMSIFGVFLGYMAHSSFQLGCNQIITQRYLSLPNTKAMGQAAIIFIGGLVLLHIICFYNGLLLFASYYDCDPLTTQLAKAKDQLVPMLVMDTLRDFPGVPGMFVAGVFSAALSSLSTGLNSMAAVILEDYIKPLSSKPLSNKQTALIMRLCTVIIGVISVALVFVVERMGTHVMHMCITLLSLCQGPLLTLFIAGLLCPRINSKSALLGAACSAVFICWLCLNAQLSGELYYEPKPVSTAGCDYDFEPLPTSTPANSTVHAAAEASFSFLQQIFHISFMYYTLFATIVGVVCSWLASYLFGRVELADVNTELLAPCMRRFYSNRYASVQLDESMFKSEEAQKS